MCCQTETQTLAQLEVEAVRSLATLLSVIVAGNDF